MVQSPMISCPLKQTAEIDWIQPLKAYIRQTYGDDPDRYSDECNTLNRLRQDMRGAGKDSVSGRDLLYRYYGQLELLDLRYDAFTQKATSQYSLAYEKASIIFNIAAVLSCHAAAQNISDDTGTKVAYHGFQASAGMFTYINDNFLHAPSTDLSRDTVKTMIAITLAQAQEVFIERSIMAQKKSGFLAKLSSHASLLYSQATEGVQENVSKGIFEKVWGVLVSAKTSYMASLAAYYQAQVHEQSKMYGTAIARLQNAEKQANAAITTGKTFSSSVPSGCNLTAETGPTLLDMLRRHLVTVQEKLAALTKDNDYIYHDVVPPEASLPPIAGLSAVNAVPVSELYQGQDIQRIIGPDIFQRIIPMAVTESASLYDEEKAKLIRAESEKVEAANGEMAASLDYLGLPGSLKVLRGDVEDEMAVPEVFRTWCEEISGQDSFRGTQEELQNDKTSLLTALDDCMKLLDMEEATCERMRVKHGADWIQQPSSQLNATMRNDIKNYRQSINEASTSDSRLLITLRQHESDFEEMRAAGEAGDADIIFPQAMIKAGLGQGKGGNGTSPSSKTQEGSLLDDDFGEGRFSVADQITKCEELLRKLNLVKNDRLQTLKDLKDKVHNDDISNVLILNKKAISNQEEQLFQTELEKYRAHQTRLLQANHKQTALLKELAKVYTDLLEDKRVKREQAKYDTVMKQRKAVLSKYKKTHMAFKELLNGLSQARAFYMHMRDTIENTKRNVEAFVQNRKSEGGDLLNDLRRDITVARTTSNEEQDQEKLKSLMERLAVDQTPLSSQHGAAMRAKSPPPLSSHYASTLHSARTATPSNAANSGLYPVYSSGNGVSPVEGYATNHNQSQQPALEAYNPMAYLYQPPISPPPNQQFFNTNPSPYAGYRGSTPATQPPHPSLTPQYFSPQGFPPPPPPPPRPSPGGYSAAIPGPYPPNYTQPRPPHSSNPTPQPQPPQSQAHNDPWASLNSWK
ncbi:bck1-like resistance to osmotic shock [Myotisia sp. PD_48]|nr:bck1-like resistance to osmotic shock [Myotisia sp. PD_48]